MLKFCENGGHVYGLRKLLRAHLLSHFLINSKVNMAGVVGPHKFVPRKSVSWKWKEKILKTMKKEEEEERKDQMLT
jgi:hypothetical protein